MLVTRKTYSLVKRYYTLAVKKVQKENITGKHLFTLKVYFLMFDWIRKNYNIPYSDRCAILDGEKDAIRPLEHFVESKTGGFVYTFKHKTEAA